MTFDDGSGSNCDGWDSDFRAKINALLQEHQIGFEAVCRSVGLDPSQVLRAIEEGTYGFPASATLLSRFMSYFHLPLDALLAGELKLHDRKKEKRLQLRNLVWQFILSDERFPWQHRRPFVEYVVGLLDQLTDEFVATQGALD